MTAAATNTQLQIPYEIGLFIASQVPYLDDHHNLPEDFNAPWAEHKGHFNYGPRASAGLGQMRQGLLLEVINCVHLPRSIYTRYGKWVILGSSSGSFERIFQVLQKTLNLKKIEEFSSKDVSYWAIQTWNGQVLDEPILAEKAEERVSYETARAEYAEFKKTVGFKV